MVARHPHRDWSLLAALAVACLATPALADPYAILASARGHVEVAPHSGAPQLATFGRSLDRGDRVIVGPAASATVYLSDGNVIEVGERSSITIGGTIAAKGAGSVPGGVYTAVSKFVTGGSRASGLVAMSTMRGGEEESPLIESPRRSDVLGDRPRFRWATVPGAKRYRVSVSGDAGDLWSRETNALALDYPADAAALTHGGDFLWKVQALGESGSLREESSVFHVLPSDAADAVRADLGHITTSAGDGSAASCYLAGSYLSARGLYDEASRQFQALIQIAPDSPAPHEALGQVYRAVGRTDLAAAEFQKALELTHTR